MGDWGWGVVGEPVGQPGEPFLIPREFRRQHIYALGRTGSGKSTFLARLALQDMANGGGLLVLDPHGDLVEDIIDHCPDKAWDRVIYLDPSDREYPVPFNLFECKPGQDRDTITSEVIGVFKRFYGEMWGPLLEDLLRSLTLTMLDHQFLNDERVPIEHRYNATLKEAHDFLFDQDMRRSYYPFISNDMVRRYWVDFYDHLGSTKGGIPVTQQQVRHSSSTTNKLRRFLLNPLLFDIVANRDFMNTIDLREIMDQRKVLLVNLSKGRLGEDNSSLLGSVLLSRLVVAALSRSDISRHERDKRIFHVIADEFQAFATDSFKLLLSEARKYGVTLTIAHQHREQLDFEMKGAALNCGSLICFRLLGRDAADVGREFDSTPTAVRYKMERGMIAQNSFLTSPIGKSVALLPRWQPWIQQINLLHAERTELVVKAGEVTESADSIKHLQCEKDDHHFCAGAEPPLVPVETYPAEVERLLQEYLPRIDQLTAEMKRLESDLAQKVGISEDDEVDWSPHREHDPDEEGWDEDRRTTVTEKGESRDLYKRVPELGTFAEREREIANELTQLPNFRAKVRLADGSHSDINTLPLPDETDERVGRIKNRREATRLDLAIPSERRRSIHEAEYFSALRRQEAAEYEAEMDDLPEPSPLASSAP